MEDAINTLTYADSGVDIDAGNQFVEIIKPLAARTKRPGVMAGLGGFGAFFDLKAAGFQDPILVATTDGVGTKLRVALEANHHRAIGIDLVAMCVNDLVVQGAQPLLFLDYYASGKLDLSIGKDIVAGIAEGCLESGCALVGGETAEMPGHYQGQDYDLAGFAIGAVERGQALTGEKIKPGDLILGLASSGAHSNGFSLIRKIVEKAGISYAEQASFASGVTYGEAFLTPTKLYVRSALAALKHIEGLAHITGGGLIDNVPRILPSNCVAEIDARSWSLPPLFRWLKEIGNVPAFDMARTFNCGIGMVVIVDPLSKKEAIAAFEAAGETIVEMGKIVEGKEAKTDLLHLESWD